MESNTGRVLGKEMKLFLTLEKARGSLVWIQDGLNLIDNLLKLSNTRLTYYKVQTPTLCSSELWKKSGHIEHFKENMYLFDDWGLKPMNCPLHFEIFKSLVNSPAKLPFTIGEVESLFRKESSGAINPPFRNFAFSQDDYHTFLREDKLISTIGLFLVETLRFYLTLNFKRIRVLLTLSPNKKVSEINDLSLKHLSRWVSRVELKGGAFYGPKLEFSIKDNMGRYWQCGTIQIDCEARKKFNLDFDEKPTFVIHRAVMGSLERFLGVLLESTEGFLPCRIHPDPYRVLIWRKEDIKRVNLPRNKISIGISEIRNSIREARLKRSRALIFLGKLEREKNIAKVQIYLNENNFKVIEIPLKSLNEEKIFQIIRLLEGV